MSINPSSNKIQNGNSLVLANPGPPGKMAVKTESVCVCNLLLFFDALYVMHRSHWPTTQPINRTDKSPDKKLLADVLA